MLMPIAYDSISCWLSVYVTSTPDTGAELNLSYLRKCVGDTRGSMSIPHVTYTHWMSHTHASVGSVESLSHTPDRREAKRGVGGEMRIVFTYNQLLSYGSIVHPHRRMIAIVDCRSVQFYTGDCTCANDMH